MTCSFGKWVDGHRYDLVSDSWSINEAFIMVSVTTAETLDEATIGKHVRSLIEDAWLAKALSMAEMLCQYRSLTRPMMDEFREEIALIERFAGADSQIDRAVELINAARTKDKHRIAAPKKRSEVRANYSRLFMAIGRRDGFCCAYCKEPSADLQIDHAVAVINGGDNDLSNLQLLCADCNSQKRDK